MPQLFVITDEWSPQPWYSTGGTRAKKYLQAPDNNFYYFKRSQYKHATDTKPGKDFKYEFWSEIIASEIGTLLGFNLLQYDIAIDGEIMGCISKSMINSEQEELIEGVKYLQAFSPLYDPEKKEHQDWYTFQLIVNALEKAKLKSEINNIIELIVFDALIGNGDRHQENWAVISRQQLIMEILEELEKDKEIKFSKFERIIIRLAKWINGIHKREKMKMPKSFYKIERRFAPIYDNGSSLGRELLENKINDFLDSDDNLNKYIDRGFAEIHWEGRKINHFELINNLLTSRYNDIVKSVINRILERWDGPEIARIVLEVDQLVPETHSQYRIPEFRKQLIIKMITLRRNRLERLLHERI